MPNSQVSYPITGATKLNWQRIYATLGFEFLLFSLRIFLHLPLGKKKIYSELGLGTNVNLS